MRTRRRGMRAVVPTHLPLVAACALAVPLFASALHVPDQPTAAHAALAWRDVSGRSYAAADLGKARATVFFFASMQCPLSNTYTPRMIELAKIYAPRGVRFFLVDSNREDNASGVRMDAKLRGYPFPAVKDIGTELADRLGARCTPEAVIVDSKGEIRYRGRIDDNPDRSKVVRSDTKLALDDLLAGKPVTRPRTLAAGCAIFREPAKSSSTASAAVTFTRDIAPILNRNCLACHRAGEVAPFPLETYQEARTWAAQIKDYTARRIMPPWKASTDAGAFHDARVMTDSEISTVAHWVDLGAPQGDPKNLPPVPAFPAADRWSLGTPDLVVQPVRAYHLGPEGKDVYRNFVLPVDFKEDRYVSAMEFKPGNRAVVHHIVTYIDQRGDSAKLDGKEQEPGYSVPGVGIGIANAQWGEVWVPGRTPRFLPPGVAVKIPKGSKLVMQVHYHRNGAPQTDTSKMALYFSKEPVHKVISVLPIGSYGFQLKPGDNSAVVKSFLSVPTDVHVHTMFPHMHLLGKSMDVVAILPDGKKLSLIKVNDWDFNWQETYEYKEPVALPRGTRVELTAVYDNSERNPHQLNNPPKLVTFGEQTTDEMCFAFIGLTVDRQNLAIAP